MDINEFSGGFNVSPMISSKHLEFLLNGRKESSEETF